MRIAIVNGSPKGKNSITLQTSLYLEKCFPEHQFEILNAGAMIGALDKDFSGALKVFDAADLVVFSYPVYTFIAPSQLHRLIALMKEHHAPVAGKFMTQITTSKHFYDITAHRYVEENAQDMGMKVIHGLSADMDDLLSEKGQKEAVQFFRRVLWSMEQDLYEPLPPAGETAPRVPASVPQCAGMDKPGDVVLVTDCEDDDIQLQGMIDRFCAVCARKVRVINLRKVNIRGGCLGCFHCAVSGQCVYPDGFDTFLRNTVQSGEAIVYAFTIRDHSMGVRFKMYDDRQFCNGHRTVTMGAPQGYLISGDYAREDNLRMIVEGRANVGGNYLCGVATNEHDTDRAIDRMAQTLCWAIENHYTQPANFLGVGGMKIFRDLIWLMRGMMRADHKFFKAHGQYDFPQKQFGRSIGMYAVGALLRNKAVQKKAGGKMTEGMLAPYRKALDKADCQRL